LKSDEGFVDCKALSTEDKNIFLYVLTKIMTAAVAKNGTVQCGASRCGNTTGTSVIHHY